MADFDKIQTENPLLDEMTYSAKLLMLSTILKSQTNADNNETLESGRLSDIYMAILSGTEILEYFEVTHADLLSAGVSNINTRISYIENPSLMPPYIKSIVMTRQAAAFKESYVEQNNYYRMLAGLPDYGKDPMYLTQECVEKMGNIVIDISIPIHLLNADIKALMREYEVIDFLLEKYPDQLYLNYIDKDINPIFARQVEDFGLLYLNTKEVQEVFYNRYKELLDINRVYIQRTMNFDAFSRFSTYYDRFIILMIIVNTVVDIINEIPEYYIRRDLFDLRTIEYFMGAYGVEFFKEIPLNYQTRLVQNLNRLIKYKSTEANIVDICKLFGFENIKVFKYYLQRKQNKNETTGFFINTDNADNDYSLNFVRVPIDDEVDNAIKTQSNIFSYDDIVQNDEYWDGPYDHNVIKSAILNKEFNVVKSKYMSIDAIYSITQISFEMAYFVNTIMFSGVSKEYLMLNVPTLSTSPMNITHLFGYLYALMYEYAGVTDNIIVTPSGYLTIRGFNFDANLAVLADYIIEQGFTAQDLGVDTFEIPKNGFLSFKQLVSVFINNKNVYEHVVTQMMHCNDKRLYDIYKHIYDSLMLTQLTFDMYKVNGTVAATYTDWVQANNASLYESIVSIRAITDETKKQATIIEKVSTAISFIQAELDNNDKLTNIFANLPSESSEAAKAYMNKIINFFKSHTITLLDLKTIYKFTDDNDVIIVDMIKSMKQSYRFDESLFKMELFKYTQSFFIQDYYHSDTNIHSFVDDILFFLRDLKSTNADRLNMIDRLVATFQYLFKDRYDIYDLLKGFAMTSIMNEKLFITDEVVLTEVY